MGSLRIDVCAAALCAALCACGARSGIDDEDPWWSRVDARANSPPLDLDATVDRELDRPPRIEAGCLGQPLPSPQLAREAPAPRRLYPTVLHDATRQRALVVGGLPATGTRTREVLAVSTVDGASRIVARAPFDLPFQPAVAWIEPGRTALVFGGHSAPSLPADSVLRLDVLDNDLRFTVVGAHPTGARTGITAVFDPARSAVIVHGGVGARRASEEPTSATWLVRLEGEQLRWRELVPASQSPPTAEERVGGIDPRSGALIMTGGVAPDGFDRSVWSLAPGDRPRWSRLDGAADALPRSGSTLEWDEEACGFLIVGGRCAGELWLLRPEDGRVREALLGALRTEPTTMGLRRVSAGVVFDRSRRSLTLIGGADCTSSGSSPLSNVVVTVR